MNIDRLCGLAALGQDMITAASSYKSGLPASAPTQPHNPAPSTTGPSRSPMQVATRPAPNPPPKPKATTPSSSSAQAPTAPVTRGAHVVSQRATHHGPPELMHGLAQALAERSFSSFRTMHSIAVPPYKPQARGVGDAETLTPGDYHISGTQVQLRALPSAKAAIKGVLTNGESVYVFGDLETDPEFMLGPNNEAVPNDGSDPGIIYARVGTQTHGAGWVAAYFLASGPGTQVQPEPKPVPVPVPALGPTTPPAKKSYVVPVLVGGAIGVAVLGTAALIYRASKKSRSQTRAYA